MGIWGSIADVHTEDVLELRTSVFSFKVMPCLLVSAQTGSEGPFHGIVTAMVFFGVGGGVFFCIFVLFVADFAVPPSTGLKCWLVWHKTAAMCVREKKTVSGQLGSGTSYGTSGLEFKVSE